MRVFLLILALTLQGDKPKLTTRVFPPIQNYDIGRGCGDVILTAEIKGEENELWYCPMVVWGLPDGTVIGSEESDCAPYEQRNECWPPQPAGCGLRGFHRNPVTGQYEDVVKECPCTVFGYPRVWRRRACIPPHPKGEGWTVVVRLEKNRNTIAKEVIDFWIK